MTPFDDTFVLCECDPIISFACSTHLGHSLDRAAVHCGDTCVLRKPICTCCRSVATWPRQALLLAELQVTIFCIGQCLCAAPLCSPGHAWTSALWLDLRPAVCLTRW